MKILTDDVHLPRNSDDRICLVYGSEATLMRALHILQQLGYTWWSGHDAVNYIPPKNYDTLILYKGRISCGNKGRIPFDPTRTYKAYRVVL